MLLLFLLRNETPVPRDIPLPLPLPEWLLVAILVVSFLVHILFVNLMVGGSILTLWAQIRGLKEPEYDLFAHEIAATITVNKSLAVVMGVAPLLSINVLYTVYFYSANALTGIMWIAIIPLVIFAFLLTYLHKYTWEALRNNKVLHMSIIGLAVLVFLFIPLIFLVNINLMMFPEKWTSIQGFLSALTLPNVFPRYLHFLCASLAVTGLFVFGYMGRAGYPFESVFAKLTRYDVRRIGYSVALGASLAQFMIGPIVLITLPSKGMGWNLLVVIFAGAAMALPAMWWMYKGLTGPRESIGSHFHKVVGLMGVVVLFMGSGRQIYRANALDPHRELMRAKTAEFLAMSEEARENAGSGSDLAIDPTLGDVAVGAAVFQKYCAACHQLDGVLVGPPVLEMAEIYENDTDGLVAWIKAPGKKRPEMPAMPPFPHLTPEELDEVAKYILSLK